MPRIPRALFPVLVFSALSLLAACGGDGSTSPGSSRTTVSIADASVTEGAAGARATLSISGTASVACQIVASTTNVSAQAVVDYAAFSNLALTLPTAGTASLPLDIVDDVLVEPAETFLVTIALAPGADPLCRLGSSVATITIVSDDVASVVSINDATVPETTSGLTAITMTNFAGRTCALTVTTANGSATAPADYAAKAGVAFSISNAASADLALGVVNDTLYEPDETFTVTIALASGADPRCQIGDGVATITITSDELPPAVISIADATVTEGMAASTMISMTNHTGVTCSVSVATSNGTATAPADYAAITGSVFTLASNPGEALVLTIVDDNFVEPVDETFNVTLSLVAGSNTRCQLGKASAVITIHSEDVASLISLGDITVNEGAFAQVPANLTNSASGVTCDVSITTANGTAVAPGDYTAITGGVFNVNNVDPIAVQTINDLVVEGAENFSVNVVLTADTDPRCQIADGQATVTILSDDTAAVVNIADAMVTEGAMNNHTTITTTTGVICSVSISTANGTATAPADYTAYTGAQFDVNNADTLPLIIVDDLLVEGNETFVVNVALIAGADPRCQIGDGQATITIVSNDAPTVVSINDATVTEGAANNHTTFNITNNGVICRVSVTTADGSAKAPGDFTAYTGALFDVNGADDLPISVVNDALVEGPETFTINIALTVSTDPRCQMADGSALITLISNE